MSRIFERPTMRELSKKKKKKDEGKRKKSKYVNFRTTPEIYDIIKRKVALTGLLKQDYYVQCILDHKVVVYADYRVRDQISKEIFQLAKVIKKYGKLDDEDSDILLFILELYEEILKEKRPPETRK